MYSLPSENFVHENSQVSVWIVNKAFTGLDWVSVCARVNTKVIKLLIGSILPISILGLVLLNNEPL